MEKIKFEKTELNKYSDIVIAFNKINEIIDAFSTVYILVERNRDRLKTLEDKIEKLERKLDTDYVIKEYSKTFEELGKPTVKEEINLTAQTAGTPGVYIEPTVKECGCYISDYTDIEDGEQCFICHRKIKKPSVKQDKIEEIISGIGKRLNKIRGGISDNSDIQECESWLRDKLKKL